MSQLRFPAARWTDEAKYEEAHYLARTARNQTWFGGPEGQQQLRGLKVAVAGLGGMGSHVAELLVRLGVGHLRIADPDTIDVSNLNRQVIANASTVGVGKAEAARRELRGIAEDFELVTYSDGVHAGNVDEFVKGCDAVIDEIDVFPVARHRELHAAARRQGIPVYTAYVVGWATHFYKFHGEEYTFEDFLESVPGPIDPPTAEKLFGLYCDPQPTYLRDSAMQRYRAEVESGRVPIYGPTTLLGQSLVTIRLIADLLKTRLGRFAPEPLRQAPETPCMPDFVVLDALDFRFERIERRVRSIKSRDAA